MITSLDKPDLNELVHFGILGMKWGKHKEESAEVSKARGEVNKQKQKLKEATDKVNKETAYGLLTPSVKSLKNLSNASREYKYSKQDLSSAKILSRLNSKEKSKSQLAMEEKYKQKGMNSDEAAVAAYHNIRTKRMLAIVGGMALTAAAGYAAYKIHDSRVDKIIKSGTVLQNISPDSTKGVRDAFYSSSNKLDNIKYKGLYGKQLSGKGGAFKKDIKTLSDIKQASYKNAKDTLSELMNNDKEFSNDVKKFLTPEKCKLGPTYALKSAAAQNNLSKNIIDKNAYEVFNASLVDHSPEMQSLTDRYFNALSSKGYNAIKDVNDSKYSGYKSINPIIAFNTKGKVDVVDVKKLTDNEIKKASVISYTDILGSPLVKKGAIIAAGILGANTANKASKQKQDLKLAAQYRKKHPETKMSNTEIVRMLERRE